MGRKIPAKKHRGVKDPLEQQARRLQSLKGKINAPPADPDDQPVPRSLQRLFAPRPHPRPTTHNHTTRTDRGGSNPVARLRRTAGESARAFSRRITDATRALHAAAPLHYPIEEEDEEEDSKGARMRALRERRTRRRRLAPGPGAPPPLSRTQKLALKKKAKKEKAMERALERPEATMERVPFGEVAHAPPSLRPPRTASASRGRSGLLLASLLQGGGDSGGGGGGGAEARRLERAREAAVAAYRALKATRATAHARAPHPSTVPTKQGLKHR